MALDPMKGRLGREGKNRDQFEKKLKFEFDLQDMYIFKILILFQVLLVVIQ